MKKNFTLFIHQNDLEAGENCEVMFNTNEREIEQTLAQLKNTEIEAPQTAINQILGYASALQVFNSAQIGKLEVLSN
ncbi:hypothetical protein EMN47_09655 [Prolixibacteraceae bacterium JC049]|nr:hypothetical protein [Prolixibacteraceae bacterium JC049]